MDVRWRGRIRVNEPFITPEQYKMFFGRRKYGVSFETANSILATNAEGNVEECVPADQLNPETQAEIIDQVMDLNTKSGIVGIEGEFLSWTWDLATFEDENGEEISFYDVEGWQMKAILEQMLYHQCWCGWIEGVS